jgi:anti-sigma-K factor RskA
MNCEDVRELAGAYALGALSPEELREVEAHLAECNLHEEMAALRATAALLAFAVEEREPTLELRSRIMAAIGAPDHRVPAPLPAPVPLRPRASRGFSRSYALAAALAAFALGMLLWNITLVRDDGPSQQVSVAQPVTFTRSIASGPGAGTKLSYIATQQVGVLEVAGLAPVPAGRTYELWTLRGKEVVGVTTFVVGADGTTRIAFSSPLAEGDTIAVTEEPAGGSLTPTTSPVFALGI